MDKSKYGVHRTHCCVIHGCKYNDEDCPVESGEIQQDYICESCDNDGIKTVEEVVRKHTLVNNVWSIIQKDKYTEDGIKEIEELNAAINRIVYSANKEDLKILLDAMNGSMLYESMDILDEYLR